MHKKRTGHGVKARWWTSSFLRHHLRQLRRLPLAEPRLAGLPDQRLQLRLLRLEHLLCYPLRMNDDLSSHPGVKSEVDDERADDQAGHQGGDLVAHAPVMRPRAYKRHGGSEIEKGGGYTTSRCSLPLEIVVSARETERSCRDEPSSIVGQLLLNV